MDLPSSWTLSFNKSQNYWKCNHFTSLLLPNKAEPRSGLANAPSFTFVRAERGSLGQQMPPGKSFCLFCPSAKSIPLALWELNTWIFI